LVLFLYRQIYQSDGTAGWATFAVLTAAYGWLCGRFWTQSATLTSDALVIRKVFGTDRVPLDDITGLSFSDDYGVLEVATKNVAAFAGGPQAFPGRSFKVVPIRIGGALWSGRCCDADRAADAIADAAGLTLLPPREILITRRRALLTLPVYLALTAAFPVVLLAGIHTQVRWEASMPLFSFAGLVNLRPPLEATIDYYFARD
jgi:hypothetical protein